jgi:hypothetical protein
VVAGDAFFSSRRAQLVTLTARDRLPAAYATRETVAAGGLMSYGTNNADTLHRVGVYTGSILNGGDRRKNRLMPLLTRSSSDADDLVILCRKGKAEEALQRLREIMGKLKLTVNEEKTRICKVPEGEFDFLGYTFGRCIQREPERRIWGTGHRGRASSAWSRTSTR